MNTAYVSPWMDEELSMFRDRARFANEIMKELISRAL
jgi:hypothetical protein